MVEIGAAIEGLRYLKDFSKWVQGLRADSEVLTRVNAALEKVGEVQDKLHELREENYRLLDENRRLADQIRAAESWERRVASYKLIRTPGGAVVYRCDEGTPHYACPKCIEDHSVQILQDKKVYSGTYLCPGCKSEYGVDPGRSPPTPRVIRG